MSPRFSNRERARRRIGLARLTYQEMAVLDQDGVPLAMVQALARVCPRCGRGKAQSCVIPEGLEHQGLFVHHERFAEITG